MKAHVVSITAPQSFPVGESRPVSNPTGKIAQITSVGLVVTADIASFGKDDIGRIIYASDQVRTITTLRDSQTVILESAFDTDLSVATAFTVVQPGTFNELSVVGIGSYTLCTPDDSVCSLPNTFKVILPTFTGAVAINPSATVVLAYGTGN